MWQRNFQRFWDQDPKLESWDGPFNLLGDEFKSRVPLGFGFSLLGQQMLSSFLCIKLFHSFTDLECDTLKELLVVLLIDFFFLNSYSINFCKLESCLMVLSTKKRVLPVPWFYVKGNQIYLGKYDVSISIQDLIIQHTWWMWRKWLGFSTMPLEYFLTFWTLLPQNYDSWEE